MDVVQIKTCYVIEDSEDEIFLTRLLFDRQNVALEIQHFFEFDTFYATVVNSTEEDLRSSLTIVDLNLKVSNGNEAVATLKSLKDGTERLVGICSGSEDPADKADAKAAGADFFVSKPLNLDAITRIASAIEALEVRQGDAGETSLWRRLER